MASMQMNNELSLLLFNPPVPITEILFRFCLPEESVNRFALTIQLLIDTEQQNVMVRGDNRFQIIGG